MLGFGDCFSRCFLNSLTTEEVGGYSLYRSGSSSSSATLGDGGFVKISLFMF